jgi:hypothetical protein
MRIAPVRPHNPPPKKDITEVLAQPVPGASVPGTVLFLVFLLCTGLFLRGERPSDVARFGSIGILAGLIGSAWFDLRLGGVRNLIRTDFMAMLALYFLTLFEFLFSQQTFNINISVDATRGGVIACLWGFAGLAVGRHLIRPKKQPLEEVLTTPVPASWLLALFWICILLSYFHMLLAVDFNPFKVLYWWMEPRFSQPWQREQLGGWKDLLVEFDMLLNLIPPLAGIMVARGHKFSFVQIALVWTGFLITLLFGFSCGTRNIFIVYLVTFLIGFAFALPPGKVIQLSIAAGICAVLLLIANKMMLEFRDIGLRAYWKGDYVTQQDAPEHDFMIDNDLNATCRVVEYFPRHHDYLGFEIPYLALIRPIPRAIWKTKPIGMSFTVEEVFNTSDLTIATSFVGEAYMIGGMIAVFLTGLFFGAIAGWWNHVASPQNSELGILIYASGFFAAVITMRSFSVFTTAALPTIVAIVGAKILMRKRVEALEKRTRQVKLRQEALRAARQR